MSCYPTLFTPCRVQTLPGYHLSPLSWGLFLGGLGLFGPETAEVCVLCSSHFICCVVPSVPGGGLRSSVGLVSGSNLLAWEKKLQKEKSLRGIFSFLKGRVSTRRISGESVLQFT